MKFSEFWTEPSLHVVIRFREVRFAVSTDIERCFCKCEFCLPINCHFNFWGGKSSPTKLLCFNTRDTLSGPKTRRRVLITHYAVKLLTTNHRTATQLLLSKKFIIEVEPCHWYSDCKSGNKSYCADAANSMICIQFECFSLRSYRSPFTVKARRILEDICRLSG